MHSSNSVPAAQATPAASFDCIRSMHRLIAHHDSIEQYLLGLTEDKPHLPACHSECLLGLSMHSGNELTPAMLALFEATCRLCEAFHEKASQAVLLREEETVSDRALMHAVQSLREISEHFQEHLVDWHLRHPNAV